MSTTTATALDYYARHQASLFPIPKGQKNPTGIVASWQKDHSADPATWAKWAASHPDCNFGVYAAGSGWIIMDTDASGDRNEAWAMRCALLTEWGMDPTALPHVQSARGGWHDYFKVPPGTDPASLRQPDAIKKRINIRCQGFTVAAGSYYDGTPRNEQSGAYILLSDQPPHPAPAALIAHCTRAPRSASTSPVTQGTMDRGDVAALLSWMAERDAFAAYEDWVAAGMAIKTEFGDSGLELWQLTHLPDVDGDTEFAKWNSFSTDADAGSVTIKSLIDRARKLGWRGTVRTSTSKMFDGVAALAAASGASLSGHSPAGMPMLAGQTTLSNIGAPILAEFLSSTNDAPTRPLANDYPDLPASLSEHGLYEPLRAAIARVIAMAESRHKLSRATDALAILSLVHSDCFDQVCRRIRTLGATVPDSKIKLAATSLADKVERAFVTNDAWVYDKNGEPQNDNSDNVQVFLNILCVELRYNAWLERMEIRGGNDADLRWSEWTYVDDAIIAKLRTRGNRTKTRFRPGKDFFWESLLALAHQNTVDPILDLLAELEAKWDGRPRLSTWLTATCGVPCDPYHQAVSRNIIGGMVARARQPGIKFDTMPVFFGPQGTGKSTMISMLAIRSEYFTDSILLGDASKELVLSLAGKLVVEISEMGMRGTANPSHVKAMISRQVDAGRTAYARSVTERQRRNIFCGSTNEDDPLQDPTGNRRFLPVKVDREVDLAWLRENINQLVGEAATLHSKGVSFDLPRSVWSAAAEHQEAARSMSDMEIHFDEWFAITEYTADAFITAQDLSELIEAGRFRNSHTQRSAILKALGFRQDIALIDGKKSRVWLRGAVMRPVDVARMATRFMVKVNERGRPSVVVRLNQQGNAT